jgi:hypothetical protein
MSFLFDEYTLFILDKHPGLLVVPYLEYNVIPCKYEMTT